VVDGATPARHPAAVPRARLVLAVLALAAAGCGSKSRPKSALAEDLDNICHAVERSGGDAEPEPANRMAVVAMWLPENVKSEEGLEWLRAFSRLGEDKAARKKMLEDAARAHGITDCPLLGFWQ
jgi:hypothetical protein